MKQNHPFRIILTGESGSQTERLELFAFLNLGIIQSLASGVMTATEAVQRFYHADNCLYVRKNLRSKAADKIMSHGIQLPDILDCLPTEEAQREFFHELETIRSLCLKLLEKGQSFSVQIHATG